MKNITLSADEHLIEDARNKAKSENTSLNAIFRQMLKDYTQQEERLQQYDDLMKEIEGKVRVGRILTREEMNER